MPARKDRIPIVLDTNVLIGCYLSRSQRSANVRVVRLWRDLRRIQLVVSGEVVVEYLDVLRRVRVSEVRVARFADRLNRRKTVTHVNLGPRFDVSRDPDDNLMLATAKAGKVEYLVTNDRDLLDIPAAERRKFRFEIVTPQEFLARLEEQE